VVSEEEVIRKMVNLKIVRVAEIKNYFSDEEAKILLSLLDRGFLTLEEKPEGMFLVYPNTAPNIVQTQLITNLLPLSIIIDPKIEEEIIKNYIVQKNSSGLASFLALNFVNKYNVKTFVTNGNSVIGVFAFDGKRYVEAEEIANKYVEDVLKKFDDLLIANNFKRVNILREYLFRVKYSNMFRFEEKPIIAFKNAVLNWENFKYGENAFQDFSPNLITFNYIDYELEIDDLNQILSQFKGLPIPQDVLESYAQKVCPNALKIFKEWVDEKWILLFEIIGYTLYPKYTFNKAIMLVGDGSNGKSTYLKVIKEILGSENVISISLQELCDNEFAFAYLYHKLANIYADLPKAPLKYTGTFKLATGEDYVSADRKFRDRITFQNYAKLLFSANELPYVSDMTIAFWRRWIVIEFKKKFTPVDGFFEKNFTKDELKGIVNVSLLAFRNVLYRQKFSFEESEADYKEIWLKKSDSVYAFLSDAKRLGVIEIVETEKTETGALYEEYTKYCEMEDVEPVSKKTFTERMESYGFPLTRSANKKFYRRIKLVKSFSDVFTPSDRLLNKIKETMPLFGNAMPRDDIIEIIKKEGYENPEQVFNDLVNSGILIEISANRFTLGGGSGD
jgi:putative DNA primase/helicase